MSLAEDFRRIELRLIFQLLSNYNNYIVRLADFHGIFQRFFCGRVGQISIQIDIHPNGNNYSNILHLVDCFTLNDNYSRT